MYNVGYLPLALQDMVEIVEYISRELCNPEAANNLADLFMKEIDSLSMFPYTHERYDSPYPLRHEYRKLVVNNYLVFYWVDEPKKQVTVSRVLFGRRDYTSVLK